jgi:predicted aminopeptidase
MKLYQKFVSKIRKMKLIYKILFTFILFLFILLISNCKLVSYGIKQGVGQIRIVRNARPIPEMMSDPKIPDSLKIKFKLVEEIKRFAYDSLGLIPSKNYNTYYDQKGKPLAWVAIGCDAYKMKAYEWKFPIVGKLPYKGFFKEEEAIEEANKLAEKGYDSRVATVSAWSTLGYFKDPILSTMLDQSEGQIARLIIHELTHSTLFIKGKAQFNENLATFIGDEGTKQYLKSKYGLESPEYKQYIGEISDSEILSTHILGGAKRLDSLYAQFKPDLPDSVKKNQKNSLIKEIIFDLDTIHFFEPHSFKRIQSKLPNNAFFIGYITYNQDQDQIWDDFINKFNSDFKAYLKYLEDKYKKE